MQSTSALLTCLPFVCASPLPPRQVYKECMESPQLSAIHLTQVMLLAFDAEQRQCKQGVRHSWERCAGGCVPCMGGASLLAAQPPPALSNLGSANTWVRPFLPLVQVESEAECDTFMPPVDEQRFKLWSASAPQRDTPDGTRYSFLCCEHRGRQGQVWGVRLPAAHATPAACQGGLSANGVKPMR